MTHADAPHPGEEQPRAGHLSDERLHAYLDGILPPAGRAVVAAHLATCARCQRRWENLHAVTAWLRRLPEAEPAADLAPRIMARLAAPPNVAEAPRWLAPLLAGQAVVAAVLLLLAWPLTQALWDPVTFRWLTVKPWTEFTLVGAELAALWARLTGGWRWEAWPEMSLPAGVGLTLSSALLLLVLALLLGVLGNRVLLRPRR